MARQDPAPWARSAVGRARRVPGYRAVRGQVLRRLRSSRMAWEVVARAFGLPGTPGHGGSGAFFSEFPSPGRLLAGRGLERIPVAVVSLVGVPEDLLDDVVEEVARLQLLTAGFRPVFVLDSPRLGAVRRYGYPVELLIEPTAWQLPDQEWEDYASRRIASIARTYGAVATLAVPDDGLGRGARVVLQSLSTG